MVTTGLSHNHSYVMVSGGGGHEKGKEISKYLQGQPELSTPPCMNLHNRPPERSSPREGKQSIRGPVPYPRSLRETGAEHSTGGLNAKMALQQAIPFIPAVNFQMI